MADERIPARIKYNVMVLASDGGVTELLKDKRGFVRPETTMNSFGSRCFVWKEPRLDSFARPCDTTYYVPAFAVELLK